MATQLELVEHVDADLLHARLEFGETFQLNQLSKSKPLADWKMEEDDAPIFRYLYRNHQPRRHLEFGTWQGTGAVYCLEESSATVWTINLLEGETKEDGGWAYETWLDEHENQAGLITRPTRSGRPVVRTDARGAIGRRYLDAGFGHRVCQIYCDSTQWDDSNYPDGFFDSVLIDGGHTREIVTSDTEKALRLTRPGGLIMWHDFCPDEHVLATCSSTHGVQEAVSEMRAVLARELRELFWIRPSWILVGVR